MTGPKDWCHYCEGFHKPNMPHQRVDPNRPKLSSIKEGLVIRPGDTVVLAISDSAEIDTPEKVEEFSRRVKEAMPDNVKVVLIDQDRVTMSVIRKEVEA